ncbi:MAG: hypothetical protein D6762_09720 [Candidatus Neomarinimicrobiota bacterium]|nr:MAG: hypothetical protein D6762_09720 [Candidatus Neomarinimicrobiota bacterium]
MEFPLRTRLAVRWTLRSRLSSPPQRLGTQGHLPDPVMVLLPLEKEYSRVARHFLREAGWERRSRFRLWVAPEARELYPESWTQIQSWTPADLTRMGLLPKKILREKVEFAAEALVNLHPRFHPVYCQLVHACPLPLKVGFQHRHAERLYHVILTNSRSPVIETGYRQIERLIG